MKFVKTLLAVALVAAIAGIVPQAHATAVNQQLWIAGSSALWQSLSIAAYNSGTNINKTPINASYTSTCHWTTGATSAGQAQSFSIEDTRLGADISDSGATWVVWSVLHTSGNTAPQDCTAAANGSVAYSVSDVWVFSNVDSVVGNHHYFAKGKIFSGYAAITSTPLPGANAIEAALYGGTTTTDDPIPQDLWNYLAVGAILNVAATDIRPEDAAWVMCRANSPSGASSVSTGSDNLDGLGYNTTGASQTSGGCAVYSSSSTQASKNVFGSPVLSGSPENSGKKAYVAAFNIVGKDPATNSTVPAYTVYPVGAAPIVFITNVSAGKLTGVTNATDQQLQQVFSGNDCNASAFGTSATGAINVILREPLSGTYNTTEANVMRYPTTYGSAPGVIGTSMENGVSNTGIGGAAQSPVNPLGGSTFHGTACAGGGGLRYRAIGTSEEVNTVRDSNTSKFNTEGDSIGFTFFSYGNVSNIAGNTSYSYLQLNGEDPIWESYYPGNNGAYTDPGQPTANAGQGVLPLNTPCGTGLGAFPCSEQQIWGNGLSFPNVRKGHYRAWSLLRLVATGTAGTYAGDLVDSAQLYAVQEVPDFIPAKEVKCPTGATTCTPATVLDPGLVIARSHYLQHDGTSGHGIGYGCATTCHIPETYPTEYQSDMGGIIIPTNQGGLTAPTTIGGTCKSLLVNNVTSTFCNGTGAYEINQVQGSSADGGRGGFVRPGDN